MGISSSPCTQKRRKNNNNCRNEKNRKMKQENSHRENRRTKCAHRAEVEKPTAKWHGGRQKKKKHITTNRENDFETSVYDILKFFCFECHFLRSFFFLCASLPFLYDYISSFFKKHSLSFIFCFSSIVSCLWVFLLSLPLPIDSLSTEHTFRLDMYISDAQQSSTRECIHIESHTLLVCRGAHEVGAHYLRNNNNRNKSNT